MTIECTIECFPIVDRSSWLALRKPFVTASDLPALFGVSKYKTPFELFAEKRGEYVREMPFIVTTENSIHLPPHERGNIDEPIGIDLAKRVHPDWTIVANPVPGGTFFADIETKMASTPDAFIMNPERAGTGTLQIKSVASSVFNAEWKQDGEIVPPIYVAIQAIAEALTSDCQYAYVGPIVRDYGIDFYLEEIPFKPALMARARKLVNDFWRRVKENDPYPADFARDGAVIASLYADADDSEADLRGNNRIIDIVNLREKLKAREKDGANAAKGRKPLDTEIIAALGNAARGRLADGRVIEAKTVRKKGFIVEPTSYRQVKVKS